MVSTNPNTIVLKGDFIQNEFQASEAINPGHLVEILSTGKVQKNDTLDQTALLFATEQEYLGKETSVAYAADDTVIIAALKPGNVVYAKVAASAAAIVIGNELIPVAGGTVGKNTDVADLTDSSGGTASDTIAAIGATYDQAEVRNAVASLAAKVNAILPGGAKKPVGIALEAVDNSGGGSEVFIRMLVL